MCGLFLTGPESRSVFEEARSLEVLTPGARVGIINKLVKNDENHAPSHHQVLLSLSILV